MKVVWFLQSNQTNSHGILKVDKLNHLWSMLCFKLLLKVKARVTCMWETKETKKKIDRKKQYIVQENVKQDNRYIINICINDFNKTERLLFYSTLSETQYCTYFSYITYIIGMCNK